MNINEFSNKMNFIEHNNCYYRTFDEITASMTVVNMNARFFAAAFYFDKAFTNAEIKEMKKNSSKGVVLQNVLDHGSIIYLLLPKAIKYSDKQIEKCENALNIFVTYLKSIDLQTSNKCVICGEEAENDAFSNLYVPVHQECIDTLKKEADENISNENKNLVNLPKSIILAFIGALVGAIPTFISIVGFNYMLSLLYALIPLCSFFGYKLGKAPKRRYATTIVIVLSVVVACGIDVFLYNIFALSYNVPLLDFIIANSSSFIADVLQSILFIALGVWISWKYISNTADNTKKNINKL